MLIGTKTDLDNQREVSYEQGVEVANKYNILFSETSSKNNKNIKEFFNEFIKKIINNYEKNKNNDDLNFDENNKIEIKKLKFFDKKKINCCYK